MLQIIFHSFQTKLNHWIWLISGTQSIDLWIKKNVFQFNFGIISYHKREEKKFVSGSSVYDLSDVSTNIFDGDNTKTRKWLILLDIES